MGKRQQQQKEQSRSNINIGAHTNVCKKENLMISIDGDFIILFSWKMLSLLIKGPGSSLNDHFFSATDTYIKSFFKRLRIVSYVFSLSLNVCVCVCVRQTIFLFKSHFMYENRLNGLNKNAIFPVEFEIFGLT